MSSENKSMKSNTIIERMVDETKTENMDWVFLGVGIDDGGKKNIFMSFVNLYGNKNLIMELIMYRTNHKNKLLIYMENAKTNDTIPLKEIKFNTKLIELSLRVLESVKSYSDEKEFLEIHDELLPVYKKAVNKSRVKESEKEFDEEDWEEGDEDWDNREMMIIDDEEETIQGYIDNQDFLEYEEEITKLLYKKGDKKFWNKFIKFQSFEDYLITSWNDKISPEKAAFVIHNDHDL